MRRVFAIFLALLLIAGMAYAQFGGPFGTDFCEYGIGPFGDCNPAGPIHGDSLDLETGDYLLTESGDTILLE